MGKLLSTAFGLLVTYWVVAPMQFASHFDTPRFHALKTELAAEHPAENLWVSAKAWVASAPRPDAQDCLD